MCSKKCVVFLIVLICFLEKVKCKGDGKQLSRKKRYIAFPEGAAFSAVYCLTSQMGITDGASIFSEGINWGLVYNLPNDTKPLFDPSLAAQKRRNRRELYVKVEDVITSMGYNGKACILRSLCEASRYFKNKEESLVHHILGLVLRFPEDPIPPHEPDDHRMYHWAAQIGSRSINIDDEPMTDECSNIFRCPFSLIELALGYYSANNELS